MAYLNTAWLSEDEHSEYIASVEDITAYNTKIDREIERLYFTKGIKVADMPVDGSGYLTSRVAQAYCITYAMYSIFTGYWGKRAGQDDIYLTKAQFRYQELKDMKTEVTQSSLLGLTDTDGNVKCSNANASQVAV